MRSKRQRIMSTACTSNSQKAAWQVPARATMGVCKPQADSESSERFRRTVSQCFPQGSVAEYVKVSPGEP